MMVSNWPVSNWRVVFNWRLVFVCLGYLGCLGLGAAGCGAPSNLDLCHAFCESARRCGVSSDADANNCNKGCDDRQGVYSDQDRNEDRDCANAGAIRQQRMDCYRQDCNKIITCMTRVDSTCVQR